MADRQSFTLINPHVRRNAANAIMAAADGSRVIISAAKRSNEQSDKFHAICGDIAKSHMTWAGKRRSLDEWKVLLVSGHTKATEGGVEFVPGLEGEFVNIRESTARMNVARAASLITYALAFCDSNGIHLTETIRGGYLDPANDRRRA